MEKFTFVAIREKQVVIEKFNYLDTCTNLLKAWAEREEKARKYFGIKDYRYICITDEAGKILAEWKDKE